MHVLYLSFSDTKDFVSGTMALHMYYNLGTNAAKFCGFEELEPRRWVINAYTLKLNAALRHSAKGSSDTDRKTKWV